MAEKPHINLVFIGHVDHGKSTILGRMFYDAKKITEQVMKKLAETAKELGKVGFEFAFFMDNLKEERERGVTINLAYKRFETDKKYFTIIDAPGHADFIKNMITGTAQADAAILVCAANDGVMAQTREHVFLAKTLGVKQIAVAVNKMDVVDYKEARFNEVKEDVSKLLKSVGYKIDEVNFIPCSAIQGDNVVTKGKMDWYKGPTLLETLDKFDAGELPTGLPLRMPVQDVFSIKGVGAVPCGRIETGTLKPGQQVIMMPSGAKGEVKTIEMHHEIVPLAKPGDNVGLNIRGIGKTDVRRGDVLSVATTPATVAKEFTAQIIVLNHPSVMTVGYTPVFHVNTSQVSCRIKEILRTIDPRTGDTIAENPDFLKNGEAAIIKVEPTRPLCIEPQKDIPQLSKFAVRDMGRTVAAGMCIDVVKK
tara:strand:- start:449 stop:1711 length:1263 start_codon:yes stop_codon:yes gene_type:complete